MPRASLDYLLHPLMLEYPGLLGQFRHLYFLLFLIAHFHKAALASMSDELAVAMNELTVR